MGKPAASTARIRVILTGRFRLESPLGQDITPKGVKTQGLIALLATSPDLSRNRRWLEGKLWSDRGPAQASASLRQSLAELRRLLGPDLDILLTDRQKVGLRRECSEIDLSHSGEREFLEGIDVRDPEFETWLRDQRHRLLVDQPLPLRVQGALRQAEAPPAAPSLRSLRRPYVVVLQKSRRVADSLGLLEDLFIDAVALSLREALGVVVFLRKPSPELPDTLTVTVQAMSAGGEGQFLRVRAVEQASGQVIWSGRSENLAASRSPEDLRLIHFANQAVEVLGDAISLQADMPAELDSLALHRLAVRKLWTMNPARLIEAETLLALSDDMKPRSLNAARRAQLRVLQVIEGHVPDLPAARQEAMAFARLAMERDPNNSMVLAVVAYVHCALDDTPAQGVELARRSVRLNPNNPLAWDSLSYAQLYSGQIEEAHALAQKVQSIGSSAPNKFWWDMGLCLTAVMSRQPELALRMAETTVAAAPDFRAALRYVVALSAGMGNEARARSAAHQLEQIESGFSLDALARNPEYPIGMLRRAGLLPSERILSISD